jgi:hypothetical protein
MYSTIEQTDQQLKAWCRDVLADVEVTFDGPAAQERRDRGSQVSLYLMGFAPLPSTCGRAPAPYQLNLQYLVTVADNDAVKSHQLLAALAFAAMGNPDFELDLSALPPAAWSAFGVAPRPGFVIRCALRQARAETRSPVVERQPLIRSARLARIDGVVLGPGDTPLMGARLELLGMDKVVGTDERGNFSFEGVPANAVVRLLVEAKGWRRELAVSAGERLQLRLT